MAYRTTVLCSALIGAASMIVLSPFMFIDHPVAVVDFEKAGEYTMDLRPDTVTTNLSKLRFIDVRPHDYGMRISRRAIDSAVSGSRRFNIVLIRT